MQDKKCRKNRIFEIKRCCYMVLGHRVTHLPAASCELVMKQNPDKIFVI